MCFENEVFLSSLFSLYYFELLNVNDARTFPTQTREKTALPLSMHTPEKIAITDRCEEGSSLEKMWTNFLFSPHYHETIGTVGSVRPSMGRDMRGYFMGYYCTMDRIVVMMMMMCVEWENQSNPWKVRE